MPATLRYDTALLDETFPLPVDQPLTRASARAAGVSDAQITRLLASGHLRRVLRGVLVATQAPDCLELRVRALRLVVPRAAVITDRTAGWVHGAPMILPPGGHVEVGAVSVFMSERGHRLRNGLVQSGARSLLPRDVEEIQGLRVTTALRTCCDLGRLQSRDQALAAMDSVLSLGRFTPDALAAEVGRFRGYRGVRRLRELVPLLDARSQSPGESILRLRWVDCPDLPRPVPQLPVLGADGRLYHADLGIQELRLAVEYDGEAFHTAASDRAWDQQRRLAFEEAGWRVETFTSADLHGPLADAQGRLRVAVRHCRAALGTRSGASAGVR